MVQEKERLIRGRGGLIAGALLIVLGIVFLLDQLFGFHLGIYVGPALTLAVGTGMFFIALSLEEERGRGFAIAGGIVTMVGAILMVQAFTHDWLSWVYTWALVAPTSAGLALWLYGRLKDHAESVKTGKKLTSIGLIMFAAAFVFFEFILGFGGYSLGRYGLPVLLILFGLFFLVRSLIRGSQES